MVQQHAERREPAEAVEERERFFGLPGQCGGLLIHWRSRRWLIAQARRQHGARFEFVADLREDKFSE
jgi:hypothetical protein